MTPRPIGWIKTLSVSGVVNLSPYSFFNAASDQPKMATFSANGTKDSLRNIEATERIHVLDRERRAGRRHEPNAAPDRRRLRGP